eukprot:SM000111S18774  [mRNA]  locus=s111:79303:79597:- [translate_table: standard]
MASPFHAQAARHARHHHRHLLLAPVSRHSATAADVCATAEAGGRLRWAIVYMAHMYPLVVPILEPEKEG